MKKIFIVTKNVPKDELEKTRESAGRYFSDALLSRSFAFLDVWVEGFSEKTVRGQVDVLMSVIETADILYLAPGWAQDPICRIMRDFGEAIGKTVVEGK